MCLSILQLCFFSLCFVAPETTCLGSHLHKSRICIQYWQKVNEKKQIFGKNLDCFNLRNKIAQFYKCLLVASFFGMRIVHQDIYNTEGITDWDISIPLSWLVSIAHNKLFFLRGGHSSCNTWELSSSSLFIKKFRWTKGQGLFSPEEKARAPRFMWHFSSLKLSPTAVLLLAISCLWVYYSDMFKE